MHGDWVTAIASIIAAVLGCLVSYVLDRYRATKRSYGCKIAFGHEIAFAEQLYEMSARNVQRISEAPE